MPAPDRERGLALLLGCFFLSGLAALVYQTAWVKQLSFVFGTSELAIATVLAAYMGGLAAGAAAAARFAPRLRRPVLAYGLLELGVAVTALAVPLGIRAARALYVSFFGALAGPPGEGGLATALFYLASAFLVLLPPTACMGATLPLLARHAVRHDRELGPRVGLLYAVNTLGAVAGTLLAGFLLLPALGLARTIWVAVAGNLLVFGLAALLARRAPPVEPDARARPRAPASRGRRAILGLIAISGAVSFGYEVLWSRLLGQLLGGSLYAFATMLAAFLTGIAGGSTLAARFATTPERAARGFALAQLGAGGLSLLAFVALDRMPRVALALYAWGAPPLFADAVVAALVLLPGTLCIGATFPFAVRVLARDAAEAGRASARVYAWNTTGAILGAIGAGFFLIPALGFASFLALAVATNLGLALAAAALLTSSRGALPWAAAAGLAALALVRPAPPWELLRSSPLQAEPARGEVLHFGVGRSASVLLLEEYGAWRLLANGLPEALIQPRGVRVTGHAQVQWLGALHLLARPDARSLLVVGLGGGAALESVPPPTETIEVIELEPEVIRANRAIAQARDVDPLADPRLRLTVNDARSALMLTRRRYDAVVSQPSHPWTVGASNLYTREFFALVREHLAPGGVLVQWLGLPFVDGPLFRTLLATLLDVLPQVRVYQPAPGEVLFLASDRPLDVEAEAARAIAAAPDAFARLGVFGAEDVAAALVLDEDGVRALARGYPVSSDDRNLLQMRAPAIARSVRAGSRVDPLLAEHDPLARATLPWDRLRIVRRLIGFGFAERAARVGEASADPVERAVTSGLVEIARGQEDAGALRLLRALQLDSGALEARVALLRLRRRALARDDPRTEALAAPLPDPARAVVDAWRAEARDDWAAVRALEARLAAVAPADPIHDDALRLRAGWRLAARSSEGAAEGAALLDALVLVTPEDLLLRAKLDRAAGNGLAAFRSLFDLALRLPASAAPHRLARDALDLLDALPPAAGAPEHRARLAAALRRAAG